MSRIVLVHGVGQEQESADSLEASWIPALAGGVRNAERPDLADRLWRQSRPGVLECRMVFYGNLFQVPGRMGNGQLVADLTPQQQELAMGLAEVWLRQAEERAMLEADRDEAYRQLCALDTQAAARQGMRAAGRPLLNALARLRWFSPAGIAFAERFADRSLAQVTRYLTEDAVREEVQGRIAAHLGPETVAIIGHSLGSVAAFQAAHRLEHELPLLVTLGSPLGLRTLVYDRLPEEKMVPPQVKRWVNLADRDDLVAAVLDLRTLFADPHGVLESDWMLDNGSQPHRAQSYLTKSQTGAPLAVALE
ncbi:alpha/beta fold hydrolase [Streptomyces sp. NPDC021080]|uniref:alpha/beta fold hydrolase n=1 Tax=Streptomyces sp. NPDC021080 TaxID=3365110 RepID=UPI00378BFA95